jgi:hypothetical protein
MGLLLVVCAVPFRCASSQKPPENQTLTTKNSQPASCQLRRKWVSALGYALFMARSTSTTPQKCNLSSTWAQLYLPVKTL